MKVSAPNKLQWLTHNKQFTPEQWVEIGDFIVEHEDLKLELSVLKLTREMEKMANTKELYSGSEIMKQNEKLQAQLAEARECIEFYAKHAYEDQITGTNIGFHFNFVKQDDIEEFRTDPTPSHPNGVFHHKKAGKRARAYLEKYK